MLVRLMKFLNKNLLLIDIDLNENYYFFEKAQINIISSMIMLVKDKNSDIAILRTMGATRSSIMRIFFLSGASIGVIGTFAGFVIGLSDSWSGVPKAGLNADNRSIKATNCLFCVVSALSLYNDSKHLK